MAAARKDFSRVCSMVPGCFKAMLSLKQSGFLGFLVIVAAAVIVSLAFAVLYFLALFYPYSGLFGCGLFCFYLGSFGGVVITPAAPAFFYLWAGILVLWIIFFIYVVFAFFLTIPSGGPSILNPPVLTPVIFLAIVFGMFANIAWIFALVRFSLTASLIVNVVGIVLLGVAAAVLSYRYAFYRDDLVTSLRFLDTAAIVIGGQNGLAMFIGWAVYLAWANVVYYISAFTPVGSIEASDVGVFGLAMTYLVYFVLDFSYLEPYTRWVISPYLVLAVASWYATYQQFEFSIGSSLLLTSVGVGVVAAVARAAVSLRTSGVFRGRKYKSPGIQTKSFYEDIRVNGDSLNLWDSEKVKLCSVEVVSGLEKD